MMKQTLPLTFLFTLISSILISPLSFAQEEVNRANDEGWTFSADFSSISIDTEAAIAEGIDDGAYAVGIYADYNSNGWINSIGIDVIFYDDNNGFSELVVGDGLFNDGDISRESSDATAGNISVASGYQWYFGEEDAASFVLQGGFSAIVSSERAIDNCSNCSSEDIDIDGGAFGQGKLKYNFGSYSIGLHLKQYVSGDLGTMAGVSFSTSL